MAVFIVLNRSTINKQDIKTISHNKIFQEEWKCPMELEIINKKQRPKLYAATTLPKSLTYSNVSAETV